MGSAEECLHAGEPAEALAAAVEALGVAAEIGQLEQGWRAGALAALASAELGQRVNAEPYREQGRAFLSRLRQRWDEESMARYLTRGDIVALARIVDM